MSPSTRTRRRPGFTFIEILTVMVIAGLLGMIGIGKFHDIAIQNRVSKAALALTGDFQEAFALAARNRHPVRIVWDPTAMQFQLTDRSVPPVVFHRVSLGVRSGFNLSSSNVTVYPSTYLEVYPNGLASDTMSVVITLNGNTRRVRVSRAGLVRVQ